MKRLTCLLLIVILLPLTAFAATKKDPELTKTLTLTAGKFQSFVTNYTGGWETDNAYVAVGVGKTIYAYAEGEANLTLYNKKRTKQINVHVTVVPEEVNDMPDVIGDAIQIGIQEWREAGGQKFSQSPKSTKWWRYACGWCGAFANYCLDSAGVPLEPSDTYRKLKPLGSGEAHSVREAAVPKIDTGFTNMDRVTKIPRPGYLVIFGEKNYDFVHVGLLTDVIEISDGVYQLFSVEGNYGSRIKRFSMIYDLRAAEKQNMSEVPTEYQTTAEIDHYNRPTKKGWYIHEFCQTWY